ncbi:pimeloyl-ACP methyl ester carboxylesterase [Cryobacterium sp. MP_M5]|uniref:alpha/beta fold hydrolase n=1 Tax=unclassified Cryobacterium TaxID=2649013 RepID=UPI0018C9E16E|nr:MULTISPECIES: alpha/beta hydrolase [unclassified Cryobacterium]MBG6058235.1 pimeloyl-ACP methyl ester carboxylesterase [Cryobacterium sp. MP_M3]MEC5176518.1 pimeloyl-ACP methyl ester carboxylesterase [Cryobacterium sp. MP_M5]
MPSVIRMAFSAAETLSPRLAGRLALILFRRVGSSLPVRPDERATHDSARVGTITVNNKNVVTYQWGTGARAVLLVHGWRGRAVQFARLIRELRAEGYTVVSFDAPANGSSDGRYTDVREYVDAMVQLQRQHGSFEAVVAHSFGVLGAISAVANGLDAQRVVGISGVAEPGYLLSYFGQSLGLEPAATAELGAAFVRRVFANEPDALSRFSGVLNPLPAAVALLLLHDRVDPVVDIEQSEQLHAAHGERSHLVVTEGLGHRRILSADVTLDAVLEFIASPLPVAPARPVERHRACYRPPTTSRKP